MRKNIIRVTLGRASRVFFSPEQSETVLFFHRREKLVYVGTFTETLPRFLGGAKKEKTNMFCSVPPLFWPAMDGLAAQQPAPKLNQQSPPPFDPSP